MNLQDQCCAKQVESITVMEEFISNISYEISHLREIRQRLEGKVNKLVGFQGVPEPALKDEKVPNSIIENLDILSTQLRWAASDLEQTVERLNPVL